MTDKDIDIDRCLWDIEYRQAIKRELNRIDRRRDLAGRSIAPGRRTRRCDPFDGHRRAA